MARLNIPQPEQPHGFKPGQKVQHKKQGHEITIGEVIGDKVHIEFQTPDGDFFMGHVSGKELRKQVR